MAVQELIDIATGRIYQRVQSDGSFGVWNELAFIEELHELWSGNWGSGAITVDGIADYSFLFVRQYTKVDPMFSVICAVTPGQQIVDSGFTYDMRIAGCSSQLSESNGISLISVDLMYNSETGELRSNVGTDMNYPIRRIDNQNSTKAYGYGIGKIYGVVRKI